MENSNLILILNTLSPKEIKACRLWLVSPAHNTRQDVVQLYDYLTDKNMAVSKKESLDVATIWAHIKPEQPLNDNLFRQTTYWLLKSIEAFLSYQYFMRNGITNQLYLLSELRERRLEKVFEKRLRETTQALEEIPLRDMSYHSNRYLLAIEHSAFAERQTRATPINIQETSDALDIQYVAQRLQNECLYYSHQNLYKADYKPKLLNEILQKVSEYGWQNIPAIGIYYHCYMSLTDKIAPDVHFAKLLEYLQTASGMFPAEEVRSLYLLAINYIIKRINTGDPLAMRQAYNLYHDGILQGYLITAGVISPWTFRNTVICGSRLGEFEWIEHFILHYQQYLERKQRHSLVQECLARLYYARKDYPKAMQLLVQAEFKDILQNLNAKTMLAKIYYETDEWEALESLLVSMKAYIRRKRVIGYHRDNYSNVIRLLQKMLSTNLFDKELHHQLISEVQQTTPLTEKNWMLEQLHHR